MIEHPLEPDRVFSRICSLLKSNGLLVMMTPNASFVDEEDQPIVFRKDLEHMQYCSFETCHFLAVKYNLQIVHLESFGSPNLARTGNHQPGFGYATLIKKIKNIMRPLPGYKIAKKISQQFKSSQRTGSYEILCIFRKSS